MTQESSIELAELIDSTVSIPSIPSTLVELDKVFGSPDCNADGIAKIIEQDPGIAAKVLRLVNSSFYSLKNPVSAIPMACAILGHRVIKNVTLQATIATQFDNTSTPDALSGIWSHSLRTAVAAQMLVVASRVDIGLTKDDAYTCGLMHDVGKLILQESFAEDYQKVIQSSKSENMPLAAAELRQFKFNHADVGGMLAREWRLSPQLCAAIQYHHKPGGESEEQILGTLLNVANTISHQADTKGEAGWLPHLATQNEIECLQVTEEDLGEIRDAVAEVSFDF